MLGKPCYIARRMAEFRSSTMFFLVLALATLVNAAKLNHLAAGNRQSFGGGGAPNLLGSYLPPVADDPCVEHTATITQTEFQTEYLPGKDVVQYVTVTDAPEVIHQVSTEYLPGNEVTVTDTQYQTVQVTSPPETIISTEYSTSVDYQTTTEVQLKTEYETKTEVEYSTQVVPTTLYSTEYETETNYLTETLTSTQYDVTTQTETETLPPKTEYTTFTNTETLPAVTSTIVSTDYSTQVQFSTIYDTQYLTDTLTETQVSTQYSTQTSTLVEPTTIYEVETTTSYETDYQTEVLTSTLYGPDKTVTVTIPGVAPPSPPAQTVYVTDTVTEMGYGGSPVTTTYTQTELVTTTLHGIDSVTTVTEALPCDKPTTDSGYQYQQPAVAFNF